MAGNKVVATTTNRITFEIDNNSYKKAIERIKGLGREFTKLGDSLGKGNPLKAWQTSMASFPMTLWILSMAIHLLLFCCWRIC